MAAVPDGFRWLGYRDSGNNYPCGCRLDGLQTEEITVIRKEVLICTISGAGYGRSSQRLTNGFR